MNAAVRPRQAGPSFTAFLAAAALILASAHEASGAPDKKRCVLLLQSYHQGYDWTDGITAGVQEVIEEQDAPIDLQIEYMDAKRDSRPASLEAVYDFYRRKLTQRDYDLVIAADDAALDFVLAHRESVFAGVPVVFCGVDDFKPQRIAGVRDITGVGGGVNSRDHLDLALRLQPDLDEFVVLGGLSQSATDNAAKFSRIAPSYAGRPRIELMIGRPLEEVVMRLRELDRQDAVFHLGPYLTPGGRLLSAAETARLIADQTEAPIYTFVEYWAGGSPEVLGGYMVSGRAVGRHVMGLASDILGGRDPDSIPVKMENPNVYIFNHAELERLGVDRAALPGGSMILGVPASFIDRNRELIWGSQIIVAALGLMVVLLLIHLALRRKVLRSLRESEARLALAINTAGLGLWDWNAQTGVCVFDDRWAGMVGYRLDEIDQTYKQWRGMVHEEDLKPIEQTIERCLGGETDEFCYEFRMRHRDGHWVWISSQGRAVERDGAGRAVRIIGLHRDITEPKQAEQRQRLMMRELDHRVKNNLAAVLSLCRESMRSSRSLEEFGRVFQSRVQAMAHTHTALANTRWQGVAVGDAVDLVLAAHLDDGGRRITREGPAVCLPSEAALPVSLSLHELMTNAAKHGALSNDRGRVCVAWRRSHDQLVIDWTERDGPPPQVTPVKGTGLQLIEGLIQYELSGRVDIHFNDEGFHCRLAVPLQGDKHADC